MRHIASRVRVGNVYVNRNIIGAVVGVQPFGGEGLSGTGPKAGGPHYLFRFAVERTLSINTAAAGGNAALLAQTKARPTGTAKATASDASIRLETFPAALEHDADLPDATDRRGFGDAQPNPRRAKLRAHHLDHGGGNRSSSLCGWFAASACSRLTTAA